MSNAHHVMSYVQFLEHKVVHQEERINILQRLNRNLVQEYARLLTEQEKAALRKESDQQPRGRVAPG